MNPGAVEEASKVATGFIDAMKGQPLGLAMVVMNLAMVAIFWMIIDHAYKRGSEREEATLKEQKEIRELLSRCVVPEQKT
jgi:mannose/fructose/N-acetylgalactosamine-specific phosphotransferase system component IID